MSTETYTVINGTGSYIPTVVVKNEDNEPLLAKQFTVDVF